MDTLFFLTSKIVWGLIRPETWIVLALLGALVMLRRRPRVAFHLIGGTVVFLLILGFVPVET